MDVSESYFESIPYEIFKHSILSGDLSSKDFLALCCNNHNIETKCEHNNQEIFQALLERDYGISILEIETTKSPKGLYTLLEKYRGVMSHLEKYCPSKDYLWYWIKYTDDIIKLFHEHYPKSSNPKWVNYELLEEDMITKMTEWLFEEIRNAIMDKNNIIKVNFGFEMIAHRGDNVEISELGIWDYLNKLGPFLTVNIREKDIVESKIDQ